MMNYGIKYTGRTVYTVNAETDTVDEWTCSGEFSGTFQGVKQGLCFLTNGAKYCVLPRKCVFLSKEIALIATKTKKQ